MPAKIGKHKLTAKEHRQWRHVYNRTGSGAQATAAVKRSIAKRKRSK